MKQGTPPREYTDARQIIADAAALKARMFAPRPPVPPPAPPAPPAPAIPEPPGPSLAEQQAAAIAAAAEEWREEFEAFREANKGIRNRREILTAVAKRHGVDVATILGRFHHKHIVAARHEAIAMIHDAHPELSTPALGRIFNRDHTTILHALSRMGRRPLSPSKVAQAKRAGLAVQAYSERKAA